MLKNIELTNYRNHENLKIEFSEGVNVIYGPNGIGKSNILEAINFLSTYKSTRALYDRDLICYNKEYAKIKGNIENNQTKDTIEVQVVSLTNYQNKTSKKIKINEVPKSISKSANVIYTVLFSPQDIDLITGSPTIRRKYFNNVLFQIDVQYKSIYSKYIKVVKTRNKLLEDINITQQSYKQLSYWNEKLIEYGQYITSKRHDIINFYNKYLDKTYKDYSHFNEEIAIEYKSNDVSTAKLFSYREKEVFAKKTLFGPHRDDFVFKLKNRNMAQFASRGEQRTCVFLIKMSELNFISNEAETKPILLLDDIFSELDTKHKEYISGVLDKHQTIITTADKNELPGVKINKEIKL